MRLYCLPLLFALSMGVQAQSNCKCCTEKFRQFDFWLGEWNVTDSTGTLLGTSKIEVIQDSCAIKESWTSAQSIFTGTSYNFYDTSKSQWTQTWVDNQGGSLFLHGGIIDGSMQLESDEIEDPQGRKLINRITWTPNDDGTVRQHWEAKVDDEDWSSLFDGVYSSKK